MFCKNRKPYDKIQFTIQFEFIKLVLETIVRPITKLFPPKSISVQYDVSNTVNEGSLIFISSECLSLDGWKSRRAPVATGTLKHLQLQGLELTSILQHATTLCHRLLHVQEHNALCGRVAKACAAVFKPSSSRQKRSYVFRPTFLYKCHILLHRVFSRG